MKYYRYLKKINFGALNNVTNNWKTRKQFDAN